MTDKKTPTMPLAGGDYVQTDNALKRVGASTEPPAGKNAPRAPEKGRTSSPRPAAAKAD